ncbi:MAG: DUF192 domain-containing protein [Minisyncoccota bacterium]
MKRYVYGGLLLVVLVSAAGWIFSRTEAPPASPAAPATPTASFGGVSLRIELATTPAEREKGLGGRTSIPEGFGMLFVFPEDGLYGFWMKDTLVPLDMFWLDDKGQVVSIAQDVATSSYPHVFYPSLPARYVLETAAGFARAHAIATGTPLSSQLLKNLPIVSE